MALSIIFVHKGFSAYLNYTVRQAYYFNPDSPIYLITDESKQKFSFVTYVNLNEFLEEANRFSKLYRHMSTNKFEHELFCFQRWFIINQVAEKMNIDKFLYLDSDALIFCNVDQVFGKFNDFDFTITNKIGPEYAFFNGKKIIDKFCTFLNQLYTNPVFYRRLEEKQLKHLNNNLPGGVCDMTAFQEYQFHNLGKVKDLAVIDNDSVFDDNINCSDGFEMETTGIKKIIFKKDEIFAKEIATGKLIRFNGLHFQGSAKRFMYRFYKGKKLYMQRFIDYLKEIKNRR